MLKRNRTVTFFMALLVMIAMLAAACSKQPQKTPDHNYGVYA
jgi:hypothetical protein